MSWRSSALVRTRGEQSPGAPRVDRVPQAMREDFKDIAGLAGYGPGEIADFIEGRMLPDDDEPATGDGEPSTWVSLEAYRLQCVTYLEARQALADVGEGRV